MRLPPRLLNEIELQQFRRAGSGRPLGSAHVSSIDAVCKTLLAFRQSAPIHGILLECKNVKNEKTSALTEISLVILNPF